jgi:hypothetical protein
MQAGRYRTLVEDLLVLPLKDRERTLQDEIGRIRVQYYARSPETRRGMIVSAARYEIESRARLIYKAAVHVLETSHAKRDLAVAEETRAVVRELIERECARLIAALQRYFEEPMEKEARSFAAEAAEQAREHAAQVELYVASLPMPPQPSVARSGTSYTFNAPVGAVQTGHGAVANIHQSAAPPEVMAALGLMIDHFRQTDSEEFREAAAVVEEIRAEIQSLKPNRLKIAGAATGVCTLIQTVADLRPAYETLKAFLQTMGINVP